MKSILIILILFCSHAYAQHSFLSNKSGKDKELSGKQSFYAFKYLKVESVEQSTYYAETDSTNSKQHPYLVLEFDTLGRLKTKIYKFDLEFKFNAPFITIPDTSYGTTDKYIFTYDNTSITYVTSRLFYTYPKGNTILTKDFITEIRYPYPGVLDGVYFPPDSLRKETLITKIDKQRGTKSLEFYVNDKIFRKEKYIYKLYSNNDNTTKLLTRIECVDDGNTPYEIKFKYKFHQKIVER